MQSIPEDCESSMASKVEKRQKARSRSERRNRIRSCPQPFDLILQTVCRREQSDSDAVEEARKLLELMAERRGTVIDLNAINASGMTALTQCALDGNLRSVKALIELGANVDRRDRLGWSPLHYAAAEGYIDIVRFLLKSNANVRATHKNGQMPMDLAEDEGVRKLLVRVTMFYSPVGRVLTRHSSLPAWL